MKSLSTLPASLKPALRQIRRRSRPRGVSSGHRSGASPIIIESVAEEEEDDEFNEALVISEEEK